ncbi:hypothetical protein PHLGIDRAFT_124779 [Phlebiopsis gigantea 11061_1 CR5-6]|uniref:Uncharacterized protein n=1 Tax=Phlebiopsis gigantea (strain 11061_1 CR5-6) TaxID=745531 RepID=A0A0C3PUK5_PHLG1|nr:hypothetical protein PHLGIDRAFT_124779 [Phlebiopsis gigantea 11061_1 CR5-6]
MKQTAQTAGGAAQERPAAANVPFVHTPSPSEAPSTREGSALSYVTYIRPPTPPPPADECPGPQDTHPPVLEAQPPPRAYQEQHHPFATYLTELGLRRVIPIFANYGFTSSKDVKIWREMVEQTRESLFQWLVKERHLKMKELVVLHNDLVKGHPHKERPAQGPTFATYLKELGLERIIRILACYGFKTQKDVQVWREMSEQTREVLFKWLMNDKLVNAKELVVLHHDLLTQQVDTSTVSNGTSTVW